MKDYFKNPNENKEIMCNVGNKNFAINEKGDTLLCFQLEPIGNSIKHKPKNIWLSEEAKIRRKQIKYCKRDCKLLNCHFD